MLIASADELLIHHFDHPAARAILPKIGERPNSVAIESLVEELANDPVEWMRHFTRFQVESWDHELAVSGFLHLGCDNRMLYVEWNALVLYPVQSRFWTVDLVSDSPWPALRRGRWRLAGLSGRVAVKAVFAARTGASRQKTIRLLAAKVRQPI